LACAWCLLLPAALASVPFRFVLVRVQVDTYFWHGFSRTAHARARIHDLIAAQSSPYHLKELFSSWDSPSLSTRTERRRTSGAPGFAESEPKRRPAKLNSANRTANPVRSGIRRIFGDPNPNKTPNPGLELFLGTRCRISKGQT